MGAYLLRSIGKEKNANQVSMIRSQSHNKCRTLIKNSRSVDPLSFRSAARSGCARTSYSLQAAHWCSCPDMRHSSEFPSPRRTTCVVLRSIASTACRACFVGHRASVESSSCSQCSLRTHAWKRLEQRMIVVSLSLRMT